MKLSCDTIQDMLPLVAEDIASEDTVKLVNEHIKDCKECKQEYDSIKEAENDFIEKGKIELMPLKSIKRKLIIRNTYFVVLTALIVSLIALIGVDKTTKPIPLSYNEAISSVEIEDGKAFITFTPEVSNYEVNSYDEFMAWETIIGRLDRNSKPKNTVINIQGEDSSIYYIDQEGELDTRIYGQDDEFVNGGRATLPRLAMNYYIIFMLGILLLLWILSFIFKRKTKIKKAISTIMMLPISYIIANILISGLGGSTHHIQRDLTFVVIGTALIFAIIISLKHKDYFINRK